MSHYTQTQKFKILLYSFKIVYSLYKKMSEKYCTVKCIPISNNKISSFLPENFNSPGEHCILVVGVAVGQELRVETGNWALLSLPKQNQNKKFACIVINPAISDDEAIVSDALYFNVTNGEGACDTALEIRPCLNQHFPTALSLEFSLLQCPNNWDANAVNDLLAGFLKSPKLMSLGDVVPVEASKHNVRLLHSSWDPDINDATAWFRVESLKSKTSNILSMWVDRSATQVTMGPPARLKTTPITHICPIELYPSLKELQSATNTFLSQDSTRRPASGCGLLLRGSGGRREVWRALGASLGLRTLRLNCRELQVAGSAGQPEAKLKAAASRAASRAPCILVLDNLEVLGWDREGNGEDARIEAALNSILRTLPNGESLVLGVTGVASELAPGVARSWLPGATLPERPPSDCRPSLKLLLARLGYYQSSLPPHLPAAGPHELRNLAFLAIRNMRQEKISEQMGMLQDEHWQHAADALRRECGVGLGLARVPTVSWQDVGGLEEVRRDVLRTVSLPLKYPALRASGLRRSGVLLHGPPGTGKTLVAKAVATECGLSFLSVKGPELLSMYVGQSEANVRDLFARARAAAPSVVFFDELDALAPGRGRGGDGGGNVTDRVVSQLMAEMDGLTRRPRPGEPEEPPVFIMAATNRPDLVEPALLRPGRFDKLLYVGPCEDMSSQLGVLKALTRKFKLGADVKLEEVAGFLPAGTAFTGADLYSACAAAWRAALRERVAAAEQGAGCKGPVEVDARHFKEALSSLKASVNPKELATKWQRQQHMFAQQSSTKSLASSNTKTIVIQYQYSSVM